MDDNADQYDQTVYTEQTQSTLENEYFAVNFPWPFQGHWLSDCCLIPMSAETVGRMTFIRGASHDRALTDTTVGRIYTGVRIEIIHCRNGLVVAQDFPFGDYMKRSDMDSLPQLMRPMKGSFGWYNSLKRAKRPDMTSFGVAIQVFLDLFNCKEIGTKTIAKGHQVEHLDEEFVITET